MKRYLSLCPAFVLVLMALIVLAGCGSHEHSPSETKPSFYATERHTSVSEVVAIDPATRLITLREEGDEAQTYLIGQDVRNVDQIKVGDMVSVNYQESISIKVLPPGAIGDEQSASLDRSQPGEKPGGTASRSFTRTAEVASVFPKTSEVVTRNAAGKLRKWDVQDPKKLENVHSGDRVQITYTEMLAVSVTPAPKPAAAPAKP